MHDDRQLRLSVLDPREEASDSVPPPGTNRRSLPTVGLFAGIGGIELGLSRAGHPTRLLCEVDDTARAVLARRFSDLAVHDDVCTLRDLPHDTQLLAGGFPCQDLSQAGRTAGIEGARSGLVGEVLRLAEAHDLPWLLLENVPFMLQLSKGRALDVIMSALERLGYMWAYRVVDARAFGVPQRRRRVLIVASKVDDPRRVLFPDDAGEPAAEKSIDDVACGFYWTEGERGLGWARDAVPTLKGGSTIGVPSPPAIWLPDGRIVTPDIRDAERMQGFKKDWTLPAETVAKPSARWKLVGNAVCVPMAKWVGERLANPGTPLVAEGEPVISGKAWPTNAWNIGDGRFTARQLSEWPKRYKTTPLREFLLHEPKPLSERATAGFLNRARRAKLVFPEGFIPAIERHLEQVKKSA